MSQSPGVRGRYDWKACAISVVAGFGVAVPTAFVVTRLIGSPLLLVTVVTLVATGVSRWTYVQVAKPGSRAD